MTEPSSHQPGRPRGSRRPPDAFDLLVARPSLADLAGHGSRLDRLPVNSTALSFLASLFVSQLMFGAPGGLLVVVLTTVTAVIAAALVRDGEVGTGRMVLRMLRGVLVGWMVAGVLLVPMPSLEGSPAWSTTTTVHRQASLPTQGQLRTPAAVTP